MARTPKGPTSRMNPAGLATAFAISGCVLMVLLLAGLVLAYVGHER